MEDFIMKRIFLLVLMLSMFAGSVNGESNETAKEDTNGEPTADVNEDTTPAQQPTAEELAYRADTTTILKLLGNIRDFQKDSSDDTEVQKNAKRRKRKETLVRFNSRYKGTRLTLQRVELSDVIADTELSAKGIRARQLFIAKNRQNPLFDESDVNFLLAFNPDCWKDTGKYNATYFIPLPKEGEQYGSGIAIGQRKINDDGTTSYEEFRQGLPLGQLDLESFKYLSVKIVKTYPNEKSVINLHKGSISPLTGTIRSILYENADDNLTIEID
jgi:hypothetical protein